MLTPNKEQMLYAQLDIAVSLLSYIKDNLDDSIFDDMILSSFLHDAKQLVNASSERMHSLILKTQEPKSVCY